MTIIQREAFPLAAGARPTPRQPDARGFAAAMAEATAAAGPPVTAPAGAPAAPAPVPLTDPTNEPMTGSAAAPTTGLATAPVIAITADLATERAIEFAPDVAWPAEPTAGPVLAVMIGSDDTSTNTRPDTDTAAGPTGDAAAAAAAHAHSDGRVVATAPTDATAPTVATASFIATAPSVATAPPAAPARGDALATPVQAAVASQLHASNARLSALAVPMAIGTTTAGQPTPATPAPTAPTLTAPTPAAWAPGRAAAAASILAGAGEAQAGEAVPAAATSSPVTPPGAPAVAPAPTVQLVSPAASPAVSPAAQPTPAPLAAQVAAPLFTLAAAGRGEHVLTISVTPDSLGPVTVRAHVTGEGVRVELFAPTDLGRDALRAILPELRRDLAGAGLGGTLDLSQQNEPAAERERHRPREPDTGDAPPEPPVAVAAPPGWGAPSTIDVFA